MSSVFNLEYDKSFWRIQVEGSKTQIKCGKKGKNGRTYPFRCHAGIKEALNYAKCYVNVKIAEGYKEIYEKKESEAVKLPTKKRNSVRMEAKQKSALRKLLSPSPPRLPAKKRKSVRREARNQSFNEHFKRRNEAKEINPVQEIVSETERLSVLSPLKKRRFNSEAIVAEALCSDKAGSAVVKLQRLSTEKVVPSSESLGFNVQWKESIGFNCVLPSACKNMSAQKLSPCVSLKRVDTKILDSDPKLSDVCLKNANVSGLKEFTTNIKRNIRKKRTRNVRMMKSILESNGGGNLTDLRSSGRPSLKKMPSLTIGEDAVYMPAHSKWPVLMKAPFIFSFSLPAISKGKAVVALHVDDSLCAVADSDGRIFLLDGAGKMICSMLLNVGVKSVVHHQASIYVGASNGNLYEVGSGFPRLLHKSVMEEEDEVESVVVQGGFLLMSSGKGTVLAFSLTGKFLWKKQSLNQGGSMLLADSSAVYHGHSRGVVKYDLHKGCTLWQKSWKCNDLCGAQAGSCIYVSDSVCIRKLQKSSAAELQTYHIGKDCRGPIVSLAASKELLFAAASHVIVYEEQTASIVYVFSCAQQLNRVAFHSSRLFVGGSEGLRVISLGNAHIKSAQLGRDVSIATDILQFKPSKAPSLLKVASPGRGELLNAVVRCRQRPGGSVAVIPIGAPESWECEFPEKLKIAGLSYTVERLQPCDSAQLYRVQGQIKRSTASKR